MQYNGIYKLKGLVEEEAKRLKEAGDAKNEALRGIDLLTNERNKIKAQIEELEKENHEAKVTINELAKNELAKEKKSLEVTGEFLTAYTEELAYLDKVEKELTEFISKEADAKERYLLAEKELNDAKTQKREIFELIAEEKEKIEIKNKELDGLKAYVSELYGKLATYVRVANDTIQHVNEKLKANKIPLQFDLPPKEITKINIDNFTEFQEKLEKDKK